MKFKRYLLLFFMVSFAYSFNLIAVNPTADITDVSPDPRNTNAGSVTITFSESVTGVDKSDFTLTRDGSTVNISSLNLSGSGATYTADLSGFTIVSGTYVFTLVASGSGIENGASEAFLVDASDTWVMDVTAPYVIDIIFKTPASSPTNAATLIYEVEFNESVNNVDINDFTLTTSGVTGTIASVSSSSGSNIEVTVNLVSGDGTIRLDLKSSGTGITDDLTNAISGGFTAGDEYTIDQTPPSGYSVSIDQSLINSLNETAVSFTFGAAETGATYNYTISSSGGGTNVTGSGTVASAGATVSGIDISGLGDGTITLSVTLTDVNGNPGTAVTDTKTKEATAPAGYSVSIDQSPINSLNETAVSFTFGAAETGATYNYTFSSSGGGTNVTGSGAVASAGATVSGIDISGLGDGTITLNVTLTDVNGNPGSAVTDTETKDATVPAGYSVSIDQSPINSLNETAVSFTFGAAEAGATYNYTFSSSGGGTNVTGSGAVASAGATVSGIDISGLGDGTITLSVTLTDVNGNPGSAVTDTETKETVPPSGYSVSIDQSLINSLNETAVSFTFGAAEAGATYNYAFSSSGGGTNVTGSGAVASAGATVSGIDISGLGDGTITLSVTLTDVNGNPGSAVTDTETKDATVPAGYSVSINQSPINSLNETAVSFTFGAAEPGATYNYTFSSTGGGTNVTGSGAVASAGATVSGIDISGLGDGTITLNVTLTDVNGNPGSAVTDTETKETVPPSGYSVSIDQSPINSLNETAVSFTFGAAEAGATYNYTFSSSGGGTNVTGSGAVASAGATVSGIDISGLGDGTITLSVTLTDVNGNPGSAVTDTETKETVPPSGYSVSIDQSPINSLNETAVSFTFGAAEPGATYNYTFSSTGGGTNVTGSGAVASAGATVSGIDISGLGDGTITLSVTLTDVNGNPGPAVTDTKTKDATAPAGYSVSIDQSPINSLNETTVSFTFGAAETGATYNYTFSSSGGGTNVTGSGAVASAGATVSGIDISGLGDGTITLNVTLTDVNGNPGSAVTDTETKDATVPNVNTISYNSPVTSITNATIITYSVTFSESVLGIDVSDFSLSLGGVTGNIASVSAATGTVINVTINSVDSDGTIRLDLNNSGTGITDLAGNPISSGFTTGDVYTIDQTPPDLNAVTISSNNTHPEIVGVGGIVRVNFTASENLSDNPLATINGRTATVSKVSGSSINWIATAATQSLDPDPVEFTLDFVDLAGNSGTQVDATTDASELEFDEIDPVLTSVHIGSNNSFSSSRAKAGDLVLIEFVSDGDIEGVSATIEGKTAVVNSSDNINWTAEYTIPSITTPPIPEGVSLTFEIDFKDYAGNSVHRTSGSTDGSLVIFDKTAPGQPTLPDLATASDLGSSDSDNITSDDTPEITCNAEPLSTVKFYTNNPAGGLLGTATESGVTPGLFSLTTNSIDGEHSITATATDAAGNISAFSSSLSITIDKISPAAPGTPEMDAASDTGDSNSDGITSDNTPTIAGSAEKYNVITITSNKDGYLGTVNSNVFGAWTYPPTLTDGDHNITVTSEDRAGNASVSASGSLTITIDTSDPLPNGTIDLDTGSDTGSSNTDNNTKDNTPTFSGTAEAGSRVTLSSNLAGVINSTIATGGTWSITSNVLNSGTHTFTAITTDLAGNSSTPWGSIDVVIDTDLPNTPDVPDLEAASDAGVSNDNITNINTPTISGTEEADILVDIYVDDVLTATVNSHVTTGAYSYTFVTPLSDGIHFVRIVCRDKAGNESASSNNLQLTIDTGAPVLSLISIASNNLSPELAKTGDVVTLSFTSTESIQTPIVVIDNKPVIISGGPTIWTASRTMGTTETEATLTFSIQYTDIAGNSGSTESSTTEGSSVRFDMTAPVVSSINIASDHANANMARIGSEVNISFSSTESIEGVSVKINTKAALVSEDSPNNWIATGYMSSSDPETVVEFTIDYKDLAGNVGSQKISTTDGSSVTLDKTKPSYSLVSIYSDNGNNSYAVDGDEVTLEFSTSEGIEIPLVSINGFAPDAITGGPTNWFATRVVGAGENEGEIPFNIDIEDYAGNVATTKFTTTDGTKVVYDDSNPGIGSVTVTAGVYKVGDIIQVLIDADDISYFEQTVKVNGTDQTLINNSNTNYTINYTVAEGDNELSSAGSLPVDIVLKDSAGLTTSKTTANSIGGTISIDTHTPLIASFTSNAETAGNAIIGDAITFTLTPVVAETGLIVSPTSYNSKPLTWTTSDGSVYTASYVVQEGDSEQSSPLQPAQIVLSDAAGNDDSFTYSLVAKKIYAEYPSAKITGTTTKCDYGQTVPVSFQFTGKKPYSLTYNDGTADIGPLIVNSNNYLIDVTEGTYTLVNLTDSTGNFVASATENATITVISLPVISTDYTNSPYNLESSADELSQYVIQADKRTGIFSAAEGVGYSSGSYYFNPGNIPPGSYDKDIEIVYTYTDPVTGCFSKDTNTVYVSSTPVKIIGLASAYCEDASEVTINGSLPIGHTGLFEIFDTAKVLVTSGYSQLDSVTLSIEPSNLPAGDYTLVYTALRLPLKEVTEFNNKKAFTIEALKTGIEITGLEVEYCFDDQADPIPVDVNFEPEVGSTGKFFGSSVFTFMPNSHKATFERSDAQDSTSYTLNYIYTSASGCIADTVSKSVYINPLPELSFNLDNNYNYDSISIPLVGTPDDPKYNFSGEGVSNNTLFTTAARVGTPLIITLSGSDDKGCSSEFIDTTIIYKASETITGIKTSGDYCYEDIVLDITCTPAISDTITGTFRSSRNALDQDPNVKNTAKYYLNRVVNGVDIVYFDYEILGTSYTVEKEIYIDGLGNVDITSSTLDFDFCNSETNIQLTGNPYYVDGTPYTGGGQGKFEYYGTEDKTTNSSSAAINPLTEVPGTYSLNYSFVTAKGCSADTSVIVNIFPEPQTGFEWDLDCPLKDQTIKFSDTTRITGDFIQSYAWRFEGGAVVSDQNPTHSFTADGVKSVSLTTTSSKGCAVELSKPITIGNFAVAKFDLDNSCFTGDEATLVSRSTGGAVNNARFKWTYDKVHRIGDTLSTSKYTFPDIGEYVVSLEYTSEDKCTDEVIDTIFIQPYYHLAKDNIYDWDFEQDDILYNWEAKSLTIEDESRWELDTPDGVIINTAASGNKAWFTKVISGKDVENSQVISPCFDLSGLERPMIKMNIWASSKSNWDGAVLQYSTDYGQTWNSLGDNKGLGIKWFNSGSITSRPGNGEIIGWSQQLATWTSVKHNLDLLKDYTIVRFRIAYAYGSEQVLEEVEYGFAFDDVWIGDRKQNLLEEYFTNSLQEEIEASNSYIRGYELEKEADIIPIHYHTLDDVLHNDYKEGPAARVFYYGVSNEPYAITNGSIRSSLINQSAINTFEIANDRESLKDPTISIDLGVNSSKVDVSLTANSDLTGKNLVLYVALVKDSVNVDNVYYYNVLRKFYPGPGGTSLNPSSLTLGQKLTKSVALSGSSEFVGSKLVVFVQNADTRKVLQSASYDLSDITTVQMSDISMLIDVYPNPARDYVFIDSRDEISNLIILDVSGRIVEELKPRTERISLAIQNYEYGIYFIKGRTEFGEFTKKFIKQ